MSSEKAVLLVIVLKVVPQTHSQVRHLLGLEGKRKTREELTAAEEHRKRTEHLYYTCLLRKGTGNRFIHYTCKGTEIKCSGLYFFESRALARKLTIERDDSLLL